MFNGDYLHHLSAIHDQQDFELIICLLWGIWMDRNRVVHGGVSRQPASIVQYTTRYHEDFTRVKVPPSTAAVTAIKLLLCHDQMLFNMFTKLNVDAATNLEQKRMGIGAIIRDHNGMVVAAFSKAIEGSFRSDEMKAKVLFHALNWVLQSQLALTYIETDALRVSSALNPSSTDLSCFFESYYGCSLSFILFPSSFSLPCETNC
ncbi:hypothetical protein CsatA_001462 [Cannabis sativa]